MQETTSHTISWMRRLDRRFTTLADRAEDLQSPVASLETRLAQSQVQVDSSQQQGVRFDKRLERLENLLETVEVDRGDN